MATDAGVARRTTDQERTARLRAYRVYQAVIMHWTNTGRFASPAQHQIRVQRLLSTWPALANALTALAEAREDLNPGEAPPCPTCDYSVDLVRTEVDPVAMAHVYVAHPCGDRMTRDQAVACWEAGVDVSVTPINGSTLAAAERARQRDVEGYDIDHDLRENGSGELVWVVWCLLDQALGDGATDPTAVPTMWPWSAEEWARYAGRDPDRLIIMAAAMLQAESDRRLALRSTAHE